MLVNILRYLVYPSFLGLAGITLFICMQKMTPDLYFLIPGIISILLILFFVAGEYFATYRELWKKDKGELWSDIISTLVILPLGSKTGELLIPVLLYYPIALFAEQQVFFNYSKTFPLWAEVLVALFLSELFYYWVHRFLHEKAVLWRFHSIHHGAKRVYWANAGRFHVLEAIFSGFFYALPLVVLSVSPETVLIILCISLTTGFLEHTNIDLRGGWLNYVFNTAELHRFHHSKMVEESNTNYGKALVLWDMVFGTYLNPGTRQVKEVGASEEVPADIGRQFLFPFR